MDDMGGLIPLGTPVWVWGKFYENVVRSILSDTWDVRQSGAAVNEWWGLSSGVIDVALVVGDLVRDLKGLFISMLPLINLISVYNNLNNFKNKFK